MGEDARAEWVALDWDSTRLRAWAMRGDAVLSHGQSDEGIDAARRDIVEAALLRLVGGWLGDGPVPVIACGLAGGRHGWIRAPHRAVPAPALDPAPTPAPPAGDRRLEIHALAGLRQDNPPDAMRGDETRIAGFLSLNAGWDGVICLVGAQTRWAHVSAGEVVSFQSFLTGELAAALVAHSLLRQSVGTAGWDGDAFAAALDAALSRPERLAADLHALHAREILESQPPQVARARMWGILIGAELAAARPYWLGQQLAIIGQPEAARPYGEALARQGVPATIADETRMTLAGLVAAWRRLRRAG